MSNIRISTVEPPFDHPATAESAIRMLCRAESIGAFAPAGRRSVLNRALVADACRALIEHEVARALAVQVLADENHEIDAERYRDLCEGVYQQLEDSPLPESEWRQLLEVFTIEGLAGLLNVSSASLRRYTSRLSNVRRDTPDGVAARLHLLALVVDALAGAYNAFGIRRWFERTRTQLRGRSPRELLAGNWTPDDDGARRVRELAQQLTTAGAT